MCICQKLVNCLSQILEQTLLLKRLVSISLNFVASDRGVGERAEDETRPGRIRRVSAGHDTHEWTSFAATEKLFERLDMMYADEAGTIPKAEL